MSVTDLLSIGASGTRAYRAAMGAVSENITNATTEGYNRRTVQLSESQSSSATSQIYKPGVAFGGVDVVAIVRNTDEYLDRAARTASGNAANADARATWLGNVQSALDDGSLGVGKQLTTMYSAIERLASNPNETTLKNNVLFTMEQVNTSFKQTASDLQSVKDGLATQANNGVLSLNAAVDRLASTNEALRRAIPGSSNAAQLLDQRDQALTDINKQVNASVTFGANGVANVTYDGKNVVDNIVPYHFGVTAAADGTFSFTVDGAAVADPESGTLAGLADSAEVTAQRVTEVTNLATQYVSDMNTWHKAGYIANPTAPTNGAAGTDILSMTGDISTLTSLITDTSKLATYSADGSPNGNLVAISSVRGTNGVENGWTAIISAHSNLLAATNAQQSAASLRDQQAQAARADVSGVDLDREAADLMRLQQAYQGSARVIQVAREVFDSILQAI